MPAPIVPALALGALALFFFGKKRTPTKPPTVKLSDGEGRTVELSPGGTITTPEGAVVDLAEVVAIEPAIPQSGPLSDGGIAILPVAETPAEANLAVQAMDAAQDREWQAAAVKAVQSQDAPTVDLLAEAMLAEGLREEAITLQAVAEQWREDAAALNTEARGETITAADVQAAEPPPPQIVANPARDAAVALADYLRPLSPWKEDREKVAALQAEIGVSADGKYGPQTAMAIAAHGIVPPAPFYWPGAPNTQAAIENYKAYLLQKAADDPTNAAAWQKAAEGAVR